MRVLGALVLAVGGSILSFFSVLAYLGAADAPWQPSASDSRLGAFAMPGLVASVPDNLADLRPIPVTTAPQTTVMPPGTTVTSTFGLQEKAKPKVSSRAAIVPPVARRLPKPTPSGDEPIVTAGTGPNQPAPVVTNPKARRPMQPLDATTRSALGGPMPSATPRLIATPSPAKPKLPRAKPASTTEAAEPTTP